MPQILTSAIGLETQRPEEVQLLSSLLSGANTSTQSLAEAQALAEQLQPWAQQWPLGDLQVDLFGWIRPLNRIDSALTWILKEYGTQLLLIPPKKDKEKQSFPSLADITSCPPVVISTVQTLLQFLTTLLTNATSKHLFPTVVCHDWLAAADDTIAHTALHVLYATALPVQLHKQPHPSHDTHTTQSHNEASVARLVTIAARGYGSAGTGTGLDWAVSSDATVPPGVGTVWCRYYDANDMEQTITADPMSDTPPSPNKRRKALVSTAELFLQLVERPDILPAFALLTDIRLARAAHAPPTRIAAVQRRLYAMTCLLYTVPDVLHQYFLTSQPELLMELVRCMETTTERSDVTFAAMQVVAALVSRRDGRLSVLALQELGVAKGQYLGVLPTLLRSCLAFLHTSTSTTTTTPTIVPDDPALSIGVSYAQAMYGASQTTNKDDTASFAQVEHILLLTASVAASPTGIAALIECGFMTTLLAILECTTAPSYVVAQAVQMMESALVTHTHAVSAFTDWNGGKALMGRLEREVNVAVAPQANQQNHGLIYTLLSCLTVYLHHDATALQTIADPLHKLLTNSTMVDGHILALVCNLISEITNNDPNVSSVVKFIHSSGLATTFLELLEERQLDLPRIPELFMSIPNILFALALTEDGAAVVQNANPYPALVSIFSNPIYSMPRSRCLLNEMPSTISASLEDIMRNVDSLKPYVLTAIVEGMRKVGRLGRTLQEVPQSATTDEQRTCLMQYILNFGQLLEQVLQHDDHVKLFMEKGGFEALVELFAVSVPPPAAFLHHASSLSCPTISSLHHATTEDVLLQATKCLQFRYDSRKFLKLVTAIVTRYLEDWETNHGSFSIQEVPTNVHVYETNGTVLERTAAQVTSIANVQWATKLLTIAIRSGGPRSMETSGSSWSLSDKEWLGDVASAEFTSLIERLGNVFHHCLRNVCQARTAIDYDDRERHRMQRHNTKLRYRLRIVCSEGAVVRDGIDIDSCANVGSLEMGEIIVAFDRCINSSGILRYRTERGWVSEMTRGHGREPIAEVFQIYEASDDTDGDIAMEENDGDEPKPSHVRIEADVPDLQTVAVGVLSRCQTVCSELFCAFSKIVLQSTRALSSPISLEKGAFGHSVAAVLAILSRHFERGFNIHNLREEVARISSGGAFDERQYAELGGTAMYLGCLVSQLQTLVFEDKRDPRKTANFPLLCAIASPSSSAENTIDLFRAARCINDYTLSVLTNARQLSAEIRVPRCVASSFPSLLSMLQKLSSSTLSSSPTASVMSRMTRSLVGKFLGIEQISDLCFPSGNEPSSSFRPEALMALIQVAVSDVLRSLWSDSRLDSLPSHVMHPLACATGEVVVALEESNNKKGSARPTSDRMRLSEFMARRLVNPARAQNNDNDDFEPNEDTIRRVAEMGFSREHAIEAIHDTRTNDINVVMEHALTSLPPSPADIQRRRDAQAARQRRREQQNTAEAAATESNDDNGEPPSEETDMAEAATPKAEDKPDTPTKHGSSLDAVVCKELDEWFQHLPSAITAMLGRIRPCHALPLEKDESGVGCEEEIHHETESLTILLSALLFDLCTKRQDISVSVMSQLIRLLKSKMDCESVVAGAESNVAILCHATALMVRSVPKSRILVLKEGLAGPLSAAVFSYLQHEPAPESSSFPVWISPSLLLLGIMAEPMAIFGDKENDEYFADPSGTSEHAAVKAEHSLRLEKLRKAANDFRSSTQKTSTVSNDVQGQEMSLDFTTFPSYFPLLTANTEATCFKSCRRILELATMESGPRLSLSLCQSVLQLLYRVLRDPATAAEAAKTTLADCILALPKSCKFEGSTALVTMVLRRLVEDRITLKASMESEIKGAILKFHMKNSESKSSIPSIPLKTLVESVTPLLYREPSTFIDAFALSGMLKMERSNDHCLVSLTPQPSKPDEPCSNDKAGTQGTHDPQPKGDERAPKGKKVKQKAATKTQKRHATPKKSRKEDSAKASAASESPSSRICSIVMTSIISWVPSDLAEEPFVAVSDLLDLLADLVLASPSCASAVHTFRVRGKDKGKKLMFAAQIQHALVGCHSPQRSFVNFVLHVLLPQDLWSIKNDPESWGRSKSTETGNQSNARRTLAVATVKLAQASARMILTLVARPGDIRKRVVSELVFALSGGMVNSSCGVTKEMSIEGIKSENAREIHALNAWGELCYAIAAPRSSGKEIEGVSAVNIASVRLLLESGMVHALLYAVKRIRLQHSMAWSTSGVLLLPLEILTRPAVTDAVLSAVRQDGKVGEAVGSTDIPDFSLPQGGGLDVHSLQDESGSDPEEQIGDAGANDGTASEDQDAMSVESDDDSIIDQSSSASSSSSDDDDSDEDMSDAEHSVGGTWDVEYDDPFAMVGEQDENEADETSDGSEPPQIDEDWTQIERQGLGGPGGHETLLTPAVRGGPNTNARGYIDAAEAMISSLMRNGDISRETLAEIEGTLGIRIVNGGRLLGASAGAEANQDGAHNAFRLRVFGAGNTASTERNEATANTATAMPSIQQRSQPDVFHAAFSRSGQGGEVSPMECVFGGPSLTGGSTNYSITERRDQASDDEAAPFPSQLNLLPSGPASVVRMRAQPVLHPLFSSLELPPTTSLVPDMRSPAERRRRRQGHPSRRLGDWTAAGSPAGGYFNSVSSGSRNRLLAAPVQRHNSGLVTWPDEGQISQSSTERLMSTIENMLDPILPPSETDGTSEEVPSTENLDVAEAEEPEDQPVDNAIAVDESAAGDQASSTVPMDVDQGLLEDGSSSLVAELRESLDVSDPVGTASSGIAPLAPAPVGTEDVLRDPETVAPGAASQELAVPDAIRSVESQQDPSADQCQPDCDMSAREQHDSEPPASTSANAQAEVGLNCPPGFDEDVFRSLPREMQQDCINQYDATQRIAEQLDGSTLDPAVLAELPEDMRREVIEQDRQQRLLAQQEQAPADPSHAQEMDNASIIASMAPELREEILMTLDESVLNTLPPQIIAEAQILRERASVRQRRIYESSAGGEANRQDNGPSNGTADETRQDSVATKKKAKSGKMKVEPDRDEIVFLPEKMESPVTQADIKALFRMLFLLTPVKPSRILQRVLSNLCENKSLRNSVTASFVWLLHGNGTAACSAIEDYDKAYRNLQPPSWRGLVDTTFSFEKQFPPSRLFGAVPKVSDSDLCNMNLSPSFMRQRQGLGTAASAAGHLRQPNDFPQASAKIPPVVAGRLLETLVHMCRNTKFCLHLITHELTPSESADVSAVSCFGKLLDLLKDTAYTTSSTTLEQLLFLLELCVYPLLHIGKQDDQGNSLSTTEAENGYAEVPRIEVSTEQLQALCSTLRMESCRDSGFSKVNSIARRLCRVEANRSKVLAELAQVADRLGSDAYQDLRALRIRMERVVSEHEHELEHAMSVDDDKGKPSKISSSLVGSISSSISLSTSTSELKLLRVLQTVQTLCNEGPEDNPGKRNDTSTASPELVDLLGKLQLGLLWDELSACLKVVQVLEGVKKLGDNTEEEKEAAQNDDNIDETAEETDPKHKTLRNSAAGLLARFLPSVEAFFVANACIVKTSLSSEKIESIDQLVGGQRMLSFAATNKVLLNALIRTNASLLDKGMRALVQIPQFRPLLDFDVKRNWFKTQVKRLRHQASRRYGSLRLQIRRGSIFQDAYFQLQPRNADEMRGRLNVTFRNEEGVDAGGLSREFFGILAKEMFNPNYALFVSTEDGITFQPNPNSMINPDHLSYFRFVGRVVGKALSDGYLLDAHFTRSLYKHMLGLEPTHHDMEAIDPDYYGNLRTILENSLEDMGLDHLTFSIEDHSFGRNQTMDLIPQGRTTKVTDENKEEYVRLVCQHRMTTSIKSQIKSYLDGFYELVSPELIAIFNPRELELLISGLPDIDVHDLKENTEYVGWKAADKEIGWFWNVIFGLSRNEKASFLQFVTGSSKVPLAGFAELQGMRGTQKFSVHKTGGPKGSLMSAHTCFNSLDLPTYESEEETRQKLLLAINEGGGAFGFA